MIKRMDDLGRIVIPKEIRDRLNLTKFMAFEVTAQNDKVVLIPIRKEGN